MARLGDVCDVRDGTHDSPSYVDTGYPLVTSKNIVDGKLDLSVVNYITLDDYNKINERSKVDDGDIIMPMIGTIGNPYLVSGFTDFAIKNVALIKFNDEKVNNKYIYYFLNSDKFKEYIAENNRGGTQKFLSLKDIRNMEINIVSLDEQLEIVEILDKISSLIKCRQEQLSKLDELIKSRFVELFGDPFKNERWSTKRLREISVSISDGSNVDKAHYKKNGDVLFLRIQNVWFNEFRLDDSVYISEDVNNEYLDTSLHHGDLLITKIGRYYTKDSSLGRVSVYLGEDDKANYSNNIMRVHLTDEACSEFVNVLMNLDDYNRYIREVSVGGTDKRALSKAIIGDLPIIMPPKELQIEFLEFIKQTDKSKLAIQQSLDKLETLKKALMQQYFG